MLRYRLRTRRGVLPDFLIVGAQKAGTTSMWTYLGSHPEIVPSRLKEPRYFDWNYARGQDWYQARFPTQRVLRRFASPERDHALTGEASTEYLLHRAAPVRAAELVPEAKIIVMVRDPVDRAFSHYRMVRRSGREYTAPILCR